MKLMLKFKELSQQEYLRSMNKKGMYTVYVVFRMSGGYNNRNEQAFYVLSFEDKKDVEMYNRVLAHLDNLKSRIGECIGCNTDKKDIDPLFLTHMVYPVIKFDYNCVAFRAGYGKYDEETNSIVPVKCNDVTKKYIEDLLDRALVTGIL